MCSCTRRPTHGSEPDGAPWQIGIDEGRGRKSLRSTLAGRSRRVRISVELNVRNGGRPNTRFAPL